MFSQFFFFFFLLFSSVFSLLSEQDLDQKILHYFPPTVPVHDQAQSVGLVQGISGFTTQFCPDETCQALTTKKHKLSFFSPETDFFLVIMVEVPKVTKSDGQDKEKWFERELEPQLLASALRHTYDAFYLLHGRLGDYMEREGPNGLRKLIADFMAIYLPVLNMGKQDIFSVLDGVSFMPLERSVWLQAECFVNEAEQTFPDLRKTLFFFKENLVCSSLDLQAVRPLSRYLFQYPPNKTASRTEAPMKGQILGLSHRGNRVNVAGEQLYLLVFKVSDAMVVFLVSELKAVEEMQTFVRNGVQQLIPEMQRSLVTFERSENNYRFVYYNAMNWALKNSMGGSRRLTRDTLHVISNMHASLQSANEVVARYGSNFVLAKRVDHRELFVIFEGSNNKDTLLDVELKTREITNSVLGNIFF